MPHFGALIWLLWGPASNEQNKLACLSTFDRLQMGIVRIGLQRLNLPHAYQSEAPRSSREIQTDQRKCSPLWAALMQLYAASIWHLI